MSINSWIKVARGQGDARSSSRHSSLARELAENTHRDHSSDSSSPMSIISRAGFLNEMHGTTPRSPGLSSSPSRSVTSTDSFLCEMHDNPGTQTAAIQEVIEPRRPATSPTTNYWLRSFEEFGYTNQLGSRWY
jgi:hypothetical protein